MNQAGDNQSHNKGSGNTTHGASSPSHPHHREWKLWKNMNAKCNDPGNGGFPCHGGRGIKVCDRWKFSFPLFIQDMAGRPSKLHSLHRIDEDRNFEPWNVAWATREQIYYKKYELPPCMSQPPQSAAISQSPTALDQFFMGIHKDPSESEVFSEDFDEEDDCDEAECFQEIGLHCPTCGIGSLETVCVRADLEEAGFTSVACDMCYSTFLWKRQDTLKSI